MPAFRFCGHAEEIDKAAGVELLCASCGQTLWGGPLYRDRREMLGGNEPSSQGLSSLCSISHPEGLEEALVGKKCSASSASLDNVRTSHSQARYRDGDLLF
jgi:hypothetical protein